MPTTRGTVRGEWTNSMILTVELLANKTLRETEDFIEEGARVQKKTFSAGQDQIEIKIYFEVVSCHHLQYHIKVS